VSDIRFTKAQGMGNDFLIIEVDDVAALPTASKLAREMCERNYGAGADGIVFVCRAGRDDTCRRSGYRLGSERGSPNHGSALLSNRVMARMRSPTTVST